MKYNIHHIFEKIEALFYDACFQFKVFIVVCDVILVESKH